MGVLGLVRGLAFLAAVGVLGAVGHDAIHKLPRKNHKRYRNRRGKPKRHNRTDSKRCQLETLRRKLELGKHVVVSLKEVCGDEFVRALMDGGASLKIPRRFWKEFVEDELHLTYNTRQRLRCFRAFQLFRSRSCKGQTMQAMCDGDAQNAKRRKGCEWNATKARGLSHALLQFFVDEIQWLRSRADSKILLNHARELRQSLLDGGMQEKDVPKLVDGAGKSWIYRWRVEHQLSMKATGMQLKVPWKKLLTRCETLMGNIFRVKALFKLLHPGKELKFMSADQKPSWFNNSGHTGTYGKRGEKAPSVRENFTKKRDQDSLLTTVQSSTEDRARKADVDAVPPEPWGLRTRSRYYGLPSEKGLSVL